MVRTRPFSLLLQCRSLRLQAAEIAQYVVRIFHKPRSLANQVMATASQG